MPYHLYRVGPFALLEKLAEFDDFKTASAQAKTLRAEPGNSPQSRIKVRFAATEQEAEALLSQVREAGPAGDD